MSRHPFTPNAPDGEKIEPGPKPIILPDNSPLWDTARNGPGSQPVPRRFHPDELEAAARAGFEYGQESGAIPLIAGGWDDQAGEVKGLWLGIAHKIVETVWPPKAARR